ncbi:MAG: glycoside hydrolase family 88 protein [Bacteroidales bacterium]
MKTMRTVAAALLFWVLAIPSGAQPAEKKTDVNTPLHLLQPDYDVPYGKTTSDDIAAVLGRVLEYLDNTTPTTLVNQKSGETVTDYSKITSDITLKQGDFRLISYEWGVTYAGMLNAGEATGDQRYTSYTIDRITFINKLYPVYKAMSVGENTRNPLRSVIDPRALDDAGSMCAAMIKTSQTGKVENLRPMIDNYIQYISTKEFRLADGTLARNRPLPNTIWLDDLFMSVPALAQMGKLTGEIKYYDDAVKQVLQFAQRMFVKEKGLFMHGWVQDMDPHPAFHWARANGWAFMTLAELLDVLPENHPEYAKVLELYRAHAKGLAAYQSGMGFWHQLIDRNDSYLETSATAIYAYAYAKGINRGWLDKKAYGPATLLAWNAVATKVNAQGQVEETCVGTGMGFDPAFYYYRPVNVYAAHGYGPVLLAGSEIIKMLKNHPFVINDSAVMF